MIYKQVEINEEQIVNLYQANRWTHYTNDVPSLLAGIQNSLFTLGAYDEDQLVGLIRVVGDGHTVIYITDILILPSFHRQGIGRTLMDKTIERFQHVRQIILTTDRSINQKLFYESLGFVSYESLDLVGYYLLRTRD